MHPDANPYKRYPSHPDEVVITAPAGTAVVINLALFHANGPNTGARAREMIALSYRPAWCGPTVQDVEPWPDEVLASLPPRCASCAATATSAPRTPSRACRRSIRVPTPRGISPRRWESA